MSRTYSIAQARHNLAAIVHELERHSLIQLTRRGAPVAVLLSLREYERLHRAQIGFWEAYTDFRSKTTLNHLAIDPRAFENTRDQSAGREVRW